MSVPSNIIKNLDVSNHIMILHHKSGTLSFSDAIQNKLGLSSEVKITEAMKNAAAFEAWYQEDRQSPFTVEFQIAENKTYVYRLQPLQEALDQLVFFMVDMQDEMLKKEIEDQKREHNKKLTNTIPCGLFKAKLSGAYQLLYKNLFFKKTFGYAEDEDITDLAQIILPEDFDYVSNRIQEKQNEVSRDSCVEVENRCVKKDGTIIWALCRFVYGEDFAFGAVFDITDRKEMQEQLRISEQEYRIAMKQSNKTMLKYHIPSRTLSMGDDQDRAFGKALKFENFPDCMKEYDYIAKESVQDFIDFYYDMIHGKPKGEAIFRMRVKGRTTYGWVKSNYILTYDDLGHPVTSIVSYQDYSETHDREVAYQRWMQTFENKKANAIAYYDYDITNNRLETMESSVIQDIPLEERTSFTYIAKYAASHYVFIEDKKKYLNSFNRDYLISCYYRNQTEILCEHRRLDACGQPYWACGEIQLMEDPFTNHIKAFVLITNIDERKRKELLVQKQLQSDPLTGLLNRKSIAEKINTILNNGDPSMHALIMLDLDNFKTLNDQFGHLKGDQMLCTVANVLSGLMRKHDLCARIGGDEYILFLCNIRDKEALRHKLMQLRDALRLDVGAIHISASLGASIYPNDGDDFAALYQKADEAMYLSKRKGRNQFMIAQES